jgi:carboxyl-terminal processing protease
MENNFKKYKFLSITTVLIIVAFSFGIYLGKSNTRQTSQEIFNLGTTTNINSSSTADMTPFWTTWKLLEQKFVYTHKDAKKITDQEKVWGAIQGLTSSYGDPYTVFMPPEESKNFENDISGNFEGVGMELAIKDKNIVVVAPLKDTPAYKAGVMKGDVIIAINGETTAGMSVDDAVKKIRGKAGTSVTLTFARNGTTKPVEITMMRGIIDVPTAETEIKGDVFVIHLYNFYALSANKFRMALREFIDSGKTKLILDLRGNPGGYLESAVDMASWFLPLGKTVVREDFGPNIEEQVYRSKGYDIFNENLKMLILADSGSASASEILAGALQENNVAKIVGTKTFGKGSVQELIKITPETSLKVTIARWLTPNGVSISDGGLTPDYKVEITEADLKANKDPQMDKAIEILNQK